MRLPTNMRRTPPWGTMTMAHGRSTAIENLKARLAEKVSTNPYTLETHGRDEGYPEARHPLAVVFAESLEDVRQVLAWASEHKMPVIPFGAGTSLEGQLIPQGPVITLDLSRMNRVVDIRSEDFLAIVEPGLSYQALNRTLRRYGLFFPVDPGADASLGGMAATNASGTTTVRYGGMRANVPAMEVVLANGERLRLGRPVHKTSSGYDLKDLFVGSEGTLGVITQLSLRLHPLPPYVHALRVFFQDTKAAAQAAYMLMAAALPVARLELIDELGLKAANRYLGRSYPETPALFVEFHSASAKAMEEELEEGGNLVREAGGGRIDAARSEQERLALWEARHRLYWAIIGLYPGRKYMITDAAVPLSRMPELVAHSRELLTEMALDGSLFGHVGDGNFHAMIAVAPDAYWQAETFSERLVEAALLMDGTATGEHGIGLRKKKFLALEHPSTVQWMRRLKFLFDPTGLLNPGKVLDPE